MVFNQLELTPVQEPEDGVRTDGTVAATADDDAAAAAAATAAPMTTEMRSVPSWVSVSPSKRAITLLLDDAYVNGWQRSKMVVLSSPTSSADHPQSNITGRVYEIDGVKGRADQSLAFGWAEFLGQELDREERWLRQHPVLVSVESRAEAEAAVAPTVAC